MREIVQKITNLGQSNELDLIERRRIRLLNQFCLIGIGIIAFFLILNLYFGSFQQAFFVALGFPLLVLPPLYFNAIQRTKLARNYFVFGVLFFINATGYYSVFNFSQRDNELFFLGFSTIVIVLYDRHEKVVFFLLTAISALVMKTIRVYTTNPDIDLNFLFSLGNMTASFICIFFFTTLYKKDLIDHIDELKKSTHTLNIQETQILEQHDELAAHRLQLNTLFDNVPIYLAMLDLEGRYKLFNSWYLHVFPNETKESLLGKRYDEAMNPELAEVSKFAVDNSIQGKTVKFNREVLLPNGETAHVYGKYVPLFNQKNEVSEVLVYATDVTKLTKIDKMLKESNAVKDKLFSIISHDLRSPINNLKSLLDLPDGLDQATFEILIGKIKNQVGAVSFTMENILSWVQTQFESFSVMPKKVALFHSVENCIRLYSEEISKKSIQIENNIDKNASIYVDEDNFSLICRNLLNNSLKFTPKNGRINISFISNGKHAVVSFLDSGIGMSQDHIDAIMNGKSFISSAVGTDGEKGSGLGMTFCKDLLAMNNAKMEIESQPNHGTKIDLVFLKKQKEKFL